MAASVPANRRTPEDGRPIEMGPISSPAMEELCGPPVVVRSVRNRDGSQSLKIGNVEDRELGEREDVLFYGDVSKLSESQQLFLLVVQLYAATTGQRRQSRALRLQHRPPGVVGPALLPVMLMPLDFDRGENSVMAPQDVIHFLGEGTNPPQQHSCGARHRQRLRRDKFFDVVSDVRRLFASDPLIVDMDVVIRRRLRSLLDKEPPGEIVGYCVRRWRELDHTLERQSELLESLADLESSSRVTLADEEYSSLLGKVKRRVKVIQRKLNVITFLEEYTGRCEWKDSFLGSLNETDTFNIVDLRPGDASNNNLNIRHFDPVKEIRLYPLPMIRDVCHLVCRRRLAGKRTGITRVCDVLEMFAEVKSDSVMLVTEDDKSIYSFSPTMADFQLRRISTANLPSDYWPDLTYNAIINDDVVDTFTSLPYCRMVTSLTGDNVKLATPLFSGMEVGMFREWGTEQERSASGQVDEPQATSSKLSLYKRFFIAFRRIRDAVLAKRP